jgi:Transposase IS66 family
MSITLPKITTLDEAKNVIEQLLQVIQKQEKAISLLQEEVARLKGQPKKPSFTAHSTGKESTAFSVTGFLGERKPWTKGSKKGKLAIDREEQLPEVAECACGGRQFKTLRKTARVVQGLVIKRDNVLYHGQKKQCVGCGKIYTSIEPDEIKGTSFNNTLQSLVSYLKFGLRVTEPLLHRMIKGFGVLISVGQVSEIMLRNSRKLTGAYRHLKTVGVAKSKYEQTDATGAKRKMRNGKIRDQYVQIISNKLVSVFAITKTYTAVSLNQFLGIQGRRTPLVSDDGSPNGDSCKCKVKQLCWVHEIRHYAKLFPFFNSHQNLQKKILRQWRKFYHLAKHYGREPTEAKKQAIMKRFKTITSQSTGYDQLDKQLRLTRKKQERLLTFLEHPYLPIQNNQCEQDLRQFVIIRKISGPTKSEAGDKSIARHLSIIQTAQKQGLDVFSTLHGLLTEKLSPEILTANIS